MAWKQQKNSEMCIVRWPGNAMSLNKQVKSLIAKRSKKNAFDIKSVKFFTHLRPLARSLSFTALRFSPFTFCTINSTQTQCISVSPFMFLFINIDSIPVRKFSCDRSNQPQTRTHTVRDKLTPKQKWYSQCTLNGAEM